MNDLENLSDEAMLRQVQIIPHIIPVSSATWWRGIKEGKFPPPYRLSARAVGWKVKDIKEWLSSRKVI